MSVTRRDLYEQVWSMPMMHLAKHYGLSNKGLSKICDKYKIPRPSRGYWINRKPTKRYKKIPLPKHKTENIDELYRLRDVSQDFKTLPEITKELVDIKKIHASILLKENLDEAHPLIKQSAKILNRIQPDPSALIIPSQNCLDIKVSKNILERALLIMDTILRAFDDNGFKVSIVGGETKVKIHEASVKFSMIEEIEMIWKPPHEHSLEGKYHFGHGTFDSSRGPNGKLALMLTDPHWACNNEFQQYWRDTKKIRLENKIDRFITALVRVAVAKQ
jgi:hypothetical protein